jgi:putative transcription factor
MADCEVCGSRQAVKQAVIEGVKFSVCLDCAKHGKIVEEKTFIKSSKPVAKVSTGNEEIVEDFSEILKRKVSQNNVKYEDLARSINEHESYVRRVIRGETVPTIALARKLEKALNVKIVEEEE